METIRDLSLKAVRGDREALRALWALSRRQNGRRCIIACDFDGTLCQSAYPTIGHANEELLKAVRLLRRLGFEMILWSCRELDDLDEALAWLRQHHTAFEVINDNSPYVISFFDYNSRKVNADEYWDDKGVRVGYLDMLKGRDM